jgi:hypothetical protein
MSETIQPHQPVPESSGLELVIEAGRSEKTTGATCGATAS